MFLLINQVHSCGESFQNVLLDNSPTRISPKASTPINQRPWSQQWNWPVPTLVERWTFIATTSPLQHNRFSASKNVAGKYPTVIKHILNDGRRCLHYSQKYLKLKIRSYRLFVAQSTGNKRKSDVTTFVGRSALGGWAAAPWPERVMAIPNACVRTANLLDSD